MALAKSRWGKLKNFQEQKCFLYKCSTHWKKKICKKSNGQPSTKGRFSNFKRFQREIQPLDLAVIFTGICGDYDLQTVQISEL